MKPIFHIISAIPLGIAGWYHSQSITFTVTLCFATIFIDLDHIIDYIINHKKSKLSINHFFEACYKADFKILVLILHSYELLPFYYLLYVFTGMKIYLALFIAFTYHILFDQLYNVRKYDLFYFFTYRLFRKFKYIPDIRRR